MHDPQVPVQPPAAAAASAAASATASASVSAPPPPATVAATGKTRPELGQHRLSDIRIYSLPQPIEDHGRLAARHEKLRHSAHNFRFPRNAKSAGVLKTTTDR